MDPLRDLGRQVAPQAPPPVFRHFGVVTAVVAGPPRTVTVRLSGSSTTTAGIRYLSWYTPTVTDTVVVERVGGDFLCVGTLA